jgi:antitoxin component YwqK of YwqJK toxin-antitoxin module
VGEFKKYYDDKTIKSVLNFSIDGKEAYAVIYHPNGFLAARGKYINQMREGKWKFFSAYINGYLISDEEYSKNLRNGLSQKFFPDSTLAEIMTYVNDSKEGEWLQYYPNGSIFLKSNYSDGMLNGKFEVWYEDGKPEFSGAYKNNLREGTWLIYNEDGTLKYQLNYVSGVTKDRQMEDDGSKLLDSLEKNKGRIADPEKTGVLR